MEHSEYKPETPIPPGETLLEILCERFEKQSGIDITTIERLLRGDTPLTDDIAEKLAKATKVPARLWTALEDNYRDAIKRRLEEVDAPFHCTYYTEGEGAQKWKMVICTSQTAKNTSSPADSQNDAPTSHAPAATKSQTAHGKDTTDVGAPSPAAADNSTSAAPETAS